MSALMHDVADAALPVAIGLAILAAAARAALWAQVDDAPGQRLAREYAEPLSTWCLVAAAVTALAVGAGGDATVLSVAPPIALGVGAMLLRSMPEPAAAKAARRSAGPAGRDAAPGHRAVRSAPAGPAAEPARRAAAPARRAAESAPPPATREPAQQSVAAAPAPGGSLWVDADEPRTPGGLWSSA